MNSDSGSPRGSALAWFRHPGLEVSYDVVGEVAHGASMEPGEAGVWRLSLEFVHLGLNWDDQGVNGAVGLDQGRSLRIA